MEILVIQQNDYHLNYFYPFFEKSGSFSTYLLNDSAAKRPLNARKHAQA